MDTPIDQAGALLHAATTARSRAQSDRAWLWIPIRVFAALTLLSTFSYLDWDNWGNHQAGVTYLTTQWSWGWGGSIWPTLYWLTAAALGTWLSQRLVRRREERIGVRMGTAVPLLVAVLAALVVARLFVSWTYPGPEILAVPVGLLVLAVIHRDTRAIAGLVASTGFAVFLVLWNREKELFQWVIVAEVGLIALALLLSSLAARPRSANSGSTHASGA